MDDVRETYEMTVQLIFWLIVALVMHTYVLYPLILWLIVKARDPIIPAADQVGYPMVSNIIAVYNEERILVEKVENLRMIDYPADRIEFLFGSDGSSDASNDILSRSGVSNLRLFAFKNRRGKPAVLNELIKEAKGDIVVFSDANTMLQPDAIEKLIAPFSNPRVGAVCGELQLDTHLKNYKFIDESSYWTYENAIKNLESQYRTTLGATGGIYAIRRDLYHPLPISKVVTDDFLIAMYIIKKGFTVKYEPSAIAYEKTSGLVTGEFKRRVRIGAANFHGISEYAQLLHPREGFVAFALWSHKLIRWFVPWMLIILVFLSAVLAPASTLYQFIVDVEIGFVLVALGGLVSEKLKLRIGILRFPYYFIAMNAALFVGFVKFLLRRQNPTWDVVR